jgi:hypothetical protein
MATPGGRYGVLSSLLVTIGNDQWAMQVCKRRHTHEVLSLPLEVSLQLFRDGWQRHEAISEAVERHVVKSCGGLPLALMIVKGAVQECMQEAEWMVRCCHASLSLCS